MSGRSITQVAWRISAALRGGPNPTSFTPNRRRKTGRGSWTSPKSSLIMNILLPAGSAGPMREFNPVRCSKLSPDLPIRYCQKARPTRSMVGNKKPALSSGFATGGIPFLVCRNFCINHQEVVKSSLFSDLPEPALQYHSGQVSDPWTDLPLTRPCQHPGCGFRMPVYFHRRSSVLSQ
jgi:hypothetical protein